MSLAWYWPDWPAGDPDEVDLAEILGEDDPVGHWTPKGAADNGSAIFMFCNGSDCTNPDEHGLELQARTRARYNEWHSSFFPDDPPAHRKPNWL